MTYQDMEKLQTQYRSLRFRQKYAYIGPDLGVTCGENRTAFALWSPLARSVTLRLYEDPFAPEPFRVVSMTRTAQGVWRHAENQSLHGLYYDYCMDHGFNVLSSGDPYARACGPNSCRCMIVDLRKTDPEGWDTDRAPEKEPEDVIWETHVKEFSHDPAGGFPEAFRGKFLAFTCSDTSLHGDGIHPTGLPYLRQLGVNTVQLMPIFDYGSVDETDPEAFNWGYDPVYYNIPEGSYATDLTDGTARIRQCKQMIQSLHLNGFRVVMDVVYNHTWSLDSPFNRTVPGYYYRHDDQGHAANGSLCGNEIASERTMCGKFILESILYWAEEYHIDGFRFDLMGLLDVQLMNRIRSALDRKYGKGEKLLYGEPWAGAVSAMPKKSYPADKQNIGLLNANIAMFCDNTRDSVKGHIFFSAQPGFVSGAENLEHTILRDIQAWCGRLPGVSAPSQIISYLSCHDNLTLFDKLKVSGPPDRDILAMYRLCAAILMTCQGHLFLLSGEEAARTKEGNDNSYNAPISLNRLDWQRAWDYAELREYYRGLIAFRKTCPGLCDKSPTDRVLSHWTRKHVLGLYMNNTGPTRQGMLCMIYNADTVPITHGLCAGQWETCITGTDSFCWQHPRSLSGSVTVPPVSAMILRKKY